MNRINYESNIKLKDTYHIPSLTMHQYMLIVQPGSNILDRIKRIQKKWTDDYQLEGVQLQSGYLLLARFNHYASLEDKLLRKLHYAAMECAPYRIGVEGFFGLPEHSIGLKISNPASVKLIQRTLQAHISGLRFPGERPYYNQYPAIGIANKLESTQYRNIWKNHEHRHFTGSFIANHTIVLRKNIQSRGWSILERFPFENIPVQTKQGVLFA